jgi:hypothetical protein
MKVNEAPEKIYLYPSDRAGEEYDAEWGDKPWGEGCVEYIRKDAFIEKACEKLKKCMYDNLMFQGRLHRKEVIETFVEDFKKYIED